MNQGSRINERVYSTDGTGREKVVSGEPVMAVRGGIWTLWYWS